MLVGPPSLAGSTQSRKGDAHKSPAHRVLGLLRLTIMPLNVFFYARLPDCEEINPSIPIPPTNVIYLLRVANWPRLINVRHSVLVA